MEVAWRASDEKGDEDDGQDDGTAPEDEPLPEAQVQQAENAYMLLTSFDRLPGTDRDGRVDPAALKQWIAQVLELAAASGRREIAEALVGQILASVPADADGTWPCRPVRELLEELQSERIERNLAARLYNQEDSPCATRKMEESRNVRWRPSPSTPTAASACSLELTKAAASGEEVFASRSSTYQRSPGWMPWLGRGHLRVWAV